MASADKAPSLVALAAASEALEEAALHVRGVREWIQRFEQDDWRLQDDEAVRLWAFAERTRDLADRIGRDGEKLAALLLKQFLTQEGSWPLTRDEAREYHEVLLALATSEADSHRRKLAEADGET